MWLLTFALVVTLAVCHDEMDLSILATLLIITVDQLIPLVCGKASTCLTPQPFVSFRFCSHGRGVRAHTVVSSW